MKNIIKKIFVLCLIFMIPFIVKANAIYTEAVNHANNYINGFKEYDKYLIFPTKEWYYFDTIIPVQDAVFSRGGFLSRKEYLITNYDNKSYLSTGIQFWTLTPGIVDSSKIFIIDYSDKERDTSLKSGIRVTEFIEPSTRVKGSGSRNNPWYFLPKYKISLETSDYRKGQISNEISKTNKISGECNDVATSLSTNLYNEEQIMVRVCPSAEYEYISTDCVKNIVSSNEDNNVLKISKVNKNILCKVNFAKKAYKIVLDTNGGSQIDIKELYLSPGLNWYKDENSRIDDKSIVKINKLPEQEGYVFTGFYTTTDGGTQIIDATGNIVNKDAYTEDGTMYANWKEAEIKYNNIANDFMCANKTVGKAPYLLNYTGDCSIHDDGNGNWRIKFLTSGILTLKRNITIDLFLVGGGGGGSIGGPARFGCTAAGECYGGGAGGGGYTNTYLNQSIESGTYDLVIGSGGAAANDGKLSYFGNSSKYFANGGKKGNGRTGGAGGSGGGGGGGWNCIIYNPDWGVCESATNYGGGTGGKYGNSGNKGNPATAKYYGGGLAGGAGGLGQYSSTGQTTCEFNEGTISACNTNVTAYGAGGAGGQSGKVSAAGTKNTGDGGGGGGSSAAGTAGGSGIIIIRNKR